MVSTDRDILLRLVVAVERIADGLEIKAVIMDHRGNLMKDVNEMDPKFFEAAERVINTPEEKTKIVESTNYYDCRHKYSAQSGRAVETEKSWLFVNSEGLVNFIGKVHIDHLEHNKEDPGAVRVFVHEASKWVLEPKKWKVDQQ